MNRHIPSLLVGTFLATATYIGCKMVMPKPPRPKTIEFSTPNPPKGKHYEGDKTGFLYIIGPDMPQTFSDDFKKVFSRYPVQVVGDGLKGITIDEVLQNLDALAEKDIDNIVVLTAAQSNAKVVLMKTPEKLKDTVKEKQNKKYVIQNARSLQLNGIDGISVDKLYGAIGQHFYNNPALQSKNLNIVHYPSYGGAAMNAFHMLPPETRVFYYSNAFSQSANTDTDLFTASYLDLTNRASNKYIPMNADGILATAAFTENTAPNNTFHMLQIENKKADVIKLNKGRTFSLGTHSSKAFVDINQVTEKMIGQNADSPKNVTWNNIKDNFKNIDFLNAKEMETAYKDITHHEGFTHERDAYGDLIAALLCNKNPLLMNDSVTQMAYKDSILNLPPPDPNKKPKPKR